MGFQSSRYASVENRQSQENSVFANPEVSREVKATDCHEGVQRPHQVPLQPVLTTPQKQVIIAQQNSTDTTGVNMSRMIGGVNMQHTGGDLNGSDPPVGREFADHVKTQLQLLWQKQTQLEHVLQQQQTVMNSFVRFHQQQQQTVVHYVHGLHQQIVELRQQLIGMQEFLLQLYAMQSLQPNQ